ncbi:PspA/IM30 family protein [Clostridium bornimense]|uniref:PspA/IM30 family protein n=1 Tax=Clostridium bornimense TaxID=1216932 RepID=UPI001C115F74|nr:PspA/IM30 family protein [Clostridium bornimense]MBU5316756.1 PspA/IM30 family protein [Clostridium bornimense]
MGVFTRVSTMFKAKVNSKLDEMENPIELLDQKIKDMEKSLSDAKIASAQVIGNARETEKKVLKAKAEVEDYDNKVRLALSKGNEDLAKKALAEKIKAENNYNALLQAQTVAREKAEALKGKLIELQKELDKTRAYRDEAAARYANAEASKTVNEIVANVNTKSNNINLDNIERNIARKEALAEGLGELKTPSLDDEFAALNELNLDAELEKYKNPSSASTTNSSSLSDLDAELEKYK